MADVVFNKNDLILDKVRNVAFHDLETKKMILRLTSVEDPSLGCTAEGEEITDAIGSLITTLYRAKKATFSGSNSLFSLDLAAAQFGSTKEIASAGNEITDYAYEVLTVGENGTITLANKPEEKSIAWVYAIDKGEIGVPYKVGAAAKEAEGNDPAELAVAWETGVITMPESAKGKSIYVEYTYKSANANKVINRSSDFPTAGSLVIYAYFKDKCTEKTYSGKVICPKAKLNPESIELALTSTGKHPFEFTMMKDYCDEINDELFSIVVSA